MAKKLYYKIGEACKKLEIQPYVLRYWETEFPFLKPNKSKSGQRVYSDREIDIIRRIKELLYEEGYTIAGAKKKLESELQNGGAASSEKAAGGGRSASRKAAGGAAPVAAAESADSETGSASGEAMDADAAKKIEKLRLGVEVALRQTREILDTL